MTKHRSSTKDYYINYGTGTGNDVITGTLDEAKAAAIAGMCYTQEHVTITEIDRSLLTLGVLVAISRWWGCAYNPAEDEAAPLADFGDFGYYGAWSDC